VGRACCRRFLYQYIPPNTSKQKVDNTNQVVNQVLELSPKILPEFELEESTELQVETLLSAEHVPDDEVSIHCEEDGHHWQLLLPEESIFPVQVLHPDDVLQVGLGEGGVGEGGEGGVGEGGEGEEAHVLIDGSKHDEDDEHHWQYCERAGFTDVRHTFSDDMPLHAGQDAVVVTALP